MLAMNLLSFFIFSLPFAARTPEIPGEASSLHSFILLRAGHIILSYAYHAMILTSATKQHAADPIII